MSNNNFDKAFDLVVGVEGGYVNDPCGVDVGIYDRLLSAMRQAIEEKMAAAQGVFVPPKNSRDHGCGVDGCQRPAYAGGLCNAHYIRKRKGKDMSAPLRARKTDDKCVKCERKTGAKGGWGMCSAHYKKDRRQTLKAAAIKAFGGYCYNCLKKYPLAVFDFHHTGDKTDNPSAMFVNKSIEEIAKELSRCILLCANCHRLEHSDDEF